MKPRSAQQLMKENMLVKHYAGSHAYGTALPSSDVDFRGVFVADPINVRTPFFPVSEATDSDEEDTKLFELAHFVKLTLDCNPNVVETLWVDDDDIVFRTDAYDHLREHRHQLLSAKIAYTTSGYALSQLKRIKGHNKWITNPQSEEPPHQKDFVTLIQWFGEEKVMPRDFDLSEYKVHYRLVPYGHETYGLYETRGFSTFSDDGTLNTMFEGERHNLGLPLAVVKFNKGEYNSTKETWSNYWKWKKNRNEARGELEEQFGYDTKHAMHLVRLLRMGYEALTEGELYVKRPDADELLAIRDGAWEYDDLVKYAEEMDELVRGKLLEETKLPRKPNVKLAAQLVMEVQDIVWQTNMKK